VIVDVNDDMELIREETFGPVMPVIPVDSLDEGIRRANDSSFGLTASGWTRSKKKAARLQRELDAGTVTINDHLVTAGEATGARGGESATVVSAGPTVSSGFTTWSTSNT
jgi:acyl-CoA reductase-like NAD-dependent aldehyde dehydrogenase